MAKFCKYCGKQLADEEVCTCPQAQADAQPQAAQPTAPQQAAPQASPFQQAAPQQAPQQAAPQAPKQPSPLADLIPYCKAYLRSPTGAANTAVAHKSLTLAIILLVIQAIAGGLALFGIISKFCGTINGAIKEMASAYSSGLFSGVQMPKISASLPMSLIYGLLGSAVAILVFAALIFAVAKLMKSSASFTDVLTACGAHSPFVTALLLLTFLLFFVSIQFGLICFLLSIVAWVAMGVPTAQAVTPGTEQGKFWIFYIVAAFLALVIGGFIFSKFFGMAVGAVAITMNGETHTVGELLKLAMQNLPSFNELMEELTNSIARSIF